jgi:aminoacrylate hydrolase
LPIAKIRDAELHYEITGAGQPLLFISGMGGVGAYWKPQIPVFSSEFQVITFDQRGTGKSTHSEMDYSVELLARDVIDLLDQLGLESVHVCGHSTGGMIAQVLAATVPERLTSIVLYGTRGRADVFTRRAMGLRRELLLEGKTELFVRSTALFLYPSWWIVENNASLQLQEDAAIANFSSPSVMASRIEAVLNHDQMSNLPKIRTPSLVLCAKDDFLTPQYYSTEMHSLIPGSELFLVEKGGHACSLTNPQGFNAPVLSFLRANS